MTESTGEHQCFEQCGRWFNSLDEMIYIEGEGYHEGRYFCESCAKKVRSSNEGEKSRPVEVDTCSECGSRTLHYSDTGDCIVCYKPG
jgi:hypothetical protein